MMTQECWAVRTCDLKCRRHESRRNPRSRWAPHWRANGAFGYAVDIELKRARRCAVQSDLQANGAAGKGPAARAGSSRRIDAE
eukprot:733856-Pleurochrysis_carterae.AAC.1